MINPRPHQKLLLLFFVLLLIGTLAAALIAVRQNQSNTTEASQTRGSGPSITNLRCDGENVSFNATWSHTFGGNPNYGVSFTYTPDNLRDRCGSPPDGNSSYKCTKSDHEAVGTTGHSTSISGLSNNIGNNRTTNTLTLVVRGRHTRSGLADSQTPWTTQTVTCTRPANGTGSGSGSSTGGFGFTDPNAALNGALGAATDPKGGPPPPPPPPPALRTPPPPAPAVSACPAGQGPSACGGGQCKPTACATEGKSACDSASGCCAGLTPNAFSACVKTGTGGTGGTSGPETKLVVKVAGGPTAATIDILSASDLGVSYAPSAANCGTGSVTATTTGGTCGGGSNYIGNPTPPSGGNKFVTLRAPELVASGGKAYKYVNWSGCRSDTVGRDCKIDPFKGITYTVTANYQEEAMDTHLTIRTEGLPSGTPGKFIARNYGIGTCAAGAGTKFDVNGSRTCDGVRIGTPNGAKIEADTVSGYRFKEWKVATAANGVNCASQAADGCTINMESGSATVTAVYEQGSETRLTINVAGVPSADISSLQHTVADCNSGFSAPNVGQAFTVTGSKVCKGAGAIGTPNGLFLVAPEKVGDVAFTKWTTTWTGDKNPFQIPPPSGGVVSCETDKRDNCFVNLPVGTQATVTAVYGSCDKSKGDANCDGNIDIVDFGIWKNQIKAGQAQGGFDADFDGNGSAGIEDFGIWKQNQK